MSSFYKGKTVLLTGPSAGIGHAMALQLAPFASKLILTARRKDKLDELAQVIKKNHPSCEVFVMPCDLGDESKRNELVQQVREEVGEIDFLINNAGFGYQELFEDSEWQKQVNMFRLNIEALCHLSHVFAQDMKKKKGGGILNISSSLSMMQLPFLGTYCATKSFVSAFSEVLRAELKIYGVTVTQICPGPVKTEFVEVAGNVVGIDSPAFIEISAEQCASESLRAFEKGKALYIPGFAMKVQMFFIRLVPQFVFRVFLGFAAKMMKKKAEELKKLKA